MKKGQIVILIIIAVAIIATVAIFGYANTNDENGVQVVTSTMVPETTEQVTNKETTTSDTTTNVTVVPEEPAQMVVDDGTGKIYFVGKDAMQLALEGDLQWRLDAAIMDTNNVYDCLRSGDQLVLSNSAKPVAAVYGLNNLPESVTILRDGYALLTFSEFEFKVEDSYKNSFAPASDEKFTAFVYCDVHNAIKSVMNIAYRNAREFQSEGFRGFRGTFSTKKMDTKVFDAWVLVTRSIELNGEEVVAYTWVLNTCGCGNQADGGNGGNGGHVVTPTAEPTQAPTQTPTQEPTAEPTQAPTQTPTQEPTAAPTQAPTQTPTQEPTAAPTQAPTQAPTRVPTQAPTQAPTPAPTAENNKPRATGENNEMAPEQPTPKPTPTAEVPPTVRPSAKPSDGGWHDELPKVDDEF